MCEKTYVGDFCGETKMIAEGILVKNNSQLEEKNRLNKNICEKKNLLVKILWVGGTVSRTQDKQTDIHVC